MAIKLIRKLGPFNRRKQGRLYGICIAKYSVLTGSKKSKPVFVNLLDLSPTGLSMSTFDVELTKGTKLELEFELPGTGKKVTVQGEAIWTRPEVERINKTGVKFSDIKPQDTQAIKDCIAGPPKAKLAKEPKKC